ncbi:hypothetical protein AU476_11965 [Cupriavidus sp. UYMSc13B]|nr:hypothetical protein AU476_11965 [Cupriavidus sp. UYMSc13B]
MRDLPGECIALAPQFTQFVEDADELRLMPLRQPALLGGIGRAALDVGDELLVALLRFREGGLGTALRFAGFIGLQHDALLHAFEPGGGLVHLGPNGGIMLGAGGLPRLKFTGVCKLQLPQGRVGVCAQDVAFGGGGLGLVRGGVALGLHAREFRGGRSKPSLLVIDLAAQRLHFGLKPGVVVASASARVVAATASVSRSSPRTAKTCSPCSMASAQIDSMALATAGGSASERASLRVCSSFQSLSSSLMVVRLPWRISA